MADPFASNKNTFYGIVAPPQITGCDANFPPHWGVVGSGGFSTTATRLYFLPYYFREIIQYTGLRARNQGTGDNGEKFRLGAYTMDTTGHPASLIVDAGEVTLDGSAAARTLATAWTPPYIGWGFLCAHHNSSASMYGVSDRETVSSVGYVQTNLASTLFGQTNTAVEAGATTNLFGGFYVDTTYGALASTAVQPTGVTQIGTWVTPYRT